MHLRLASGVEDGAEHHLEVAGADALEGLLFGDDAFVHQIDHDLHGGGRRALPVAGLQEVEAALFDGELDVLHVAEVQLELLLEHVELGVDLGHRLLERLHALGGRLPAVPVDRARGVGAGDDVLSLRVGEPLAEEVLEARLGVARERDAGGAGIAHVAEDHRLDVHGGAAVVRDAVGLAVVAGALAVEGAEHGLDGEAELLLRVLREGGARGLRHYLLQAHGEGAQLVDREVTGGALAAHLVRDAGEAGVVDAEHHVPEHRDEAAVGVVGEVTATGALGEALDRGVVQAEVEHGVHHAGHGRGGAGAHAEEERVGGVAEALAGARLDLGEGDAGLVPEALGVGLAVLHPVVAGGGRDGEARGHGEAEAGHLREARALAAQQGLHRPVAVGLAVAECVDPVHRVHGHSPERRVKSASPEKRSTMERSRPRRLARAVVSSHMTRTASK